MPLDLRKLVGEARPFSYAAGVCLVALALCFELFLSKLTGSSPSTTFFAVSIAMSAWYGGAGPGILALILSAVAIDYLVVVPGTLPALFEHRRTRTLRLLHPRLVRILPADRADLSDSPSRPQSAPHGRADGTAVRSCRAAHGRARTGAHAWRRHRSRRSGTAARVRSGCRHHGADAKRRARAPRSSESSDSIRMARS